MVGRLLPSDAETDAPATAMTTRARRKLSIAGTALCRRGAVRCRTCCEIMFPPPRDHGNNWVRLCASRVFESPLARHITRSRDFLFREGYTRLGDRSSDGGGAPVAAAGTGSTSRNHQETSAWCSGRGRGRHPGRRSSRSREVEAPAGLHLDGCRHVVSDWAWGRRTRAEPC